MKLILLAAAAIIAAPATAQMSGSTGTSSPTNVGGQGTPTDTRNAATAADPAAMPADSTSSQMPPASSPDAAMMQPPMASTTPEAAATAGGYQPSMPALQGTAGGPVVFRAAPTPTEAFPPPAPMASYPMCKKGEFDNCMQGPGSTHSRQVRGRSRK